MTEQVHITTGDPPLSAKGLNGSVIIDGVLFGERAQVANWVIQVLGGGIVEVGYDGFGIVAPDLPGGQAPTTIELHGGVYFWGYETGKHNDLICSVAVSDAILNNMAAYKPAIRQILDYPFGQLKLPRISAEMALNNADGVKAATKLGFRLEGRKRKKMADGTDMGIFGLLAEDAKAAGFWAPYN